MENFHEILKNHHEYARDWKKKTGCKVLGYYEPYMPEEVAYADGFLPGRLLSEHEPMGLLRSGLKEEEVLASYLFAITWRLYALIGRIKPEKDIAFTGGLAKNPCIVKRLERELGLKALNSPYDPQLAGAIGAALIAI